MAISTKKGPSAKLRAPRDRGRPVAGVHVTHGNQISWPDKGQSPAEHAAGISHFDRAENINQRGFAAVLAPAGLIFDYLGFVCHG